MKSFGPVDAQLLAPISIPIDSEWVGRQPVSDDAFEAMRFQFTSATPTPKSVKVERIQEADTWTLDEVVLAFGDNETFSIFLALPRGVRGKLQPVLYGPAGDAFALPRPNRDVVEQLRTVDVVVNGRRALVIPIWSGTYQRAVALSTDVAARAERLRVAALRWYEDTSTTLAYLRTRDDIDPDRVGYLGFSAGGVYIAPPLLAVDGRVKAAVLIGTGLPMSRVPPMSDAVHYAPRIHCPVLMINGRYDTVYPYELSQLRMFELLGSRAADKRQILYDGGHFAFPRNLLAKEMTDWFDKYLGPVQ
jgi:eukaryotic-like serine/threonine-protein kinase